MHSMHKLGFVFNFIEKILYFITSLLVFESDYSLRMFKEKVKTKSKKFIVNLNGVEVLSTESKLLQSKPLYKVASFGALRKIKAYDLIIKAIAQLKNKGMVVDLSLIHISEPTRPY